MKKILTILLILITGGSLLAQVPQKFSYQAVVRNNNGEVISNQNISIKVTLLAGGVSGSAVYTETHSVTSSPLGIVTLLVGDGEDQVGIFSAIPWNEGIFIKIEIDLLGGNGFVELGTSQIVSVPYAIEAGSLATGKIRVKASVEHNPEEPIFEVRNSNDEVVFAVYEKGTRVYVNKSEPAKGSRGGFAIGGIGDNIKEGTIPHYLTIEPDSVRFNIDQSTKGSRGGFAIGGIGDNIKESLIDYMFIHPDSIRFAVNESLPEKGSRGGFAIGGIGDNIKLINNYLFVNQDCTFVYNTLSAAGDINIGGNIYTGGTITTPPVSFNGYTYQTIKIGNQTWFKENLRTLFYESGESISAFNGVFVYGYEIITAGALESEDAIKYGLLYSWQALEVPDNVCPAGWHVPNYGDWDELLMTIGFDGSGVDYVLAGTRLMEVGFWNLALGDLTPNNLSGFSGRPGGYGQYPNQYFDINDRGYFWTSQQGLGNPAAVYSLSKSDGVEWIENFGLSGNEMYSVRCIKDNW
jgi:uncharacterized protein (TIGR02145 family)